MLQRIWQRWRRGAESENDDGDDSSDGYDGDDSNDDIDEEDEQEGALGNHKLGAIYQFIRAMPEVFEEAPATGEVQLMDID